MSFELMSLPYAKDALQPFMSSTTLDFHHGKHHKAYVDMLNKLVDGTPYAGASLDEIVKDSYNKEGKEKIFNNSGQIWNHDFFWNGMKAANQTGGKPTGDIAKAIDDAFGSFDEFKSKFSEAATTQFGSGWAWLIADSAGKLSITKTPNAVNPLALGQRALLTCDVWEHAYYLDYQNRRADMVGAFLDHLVNWDFVAKNRG